MPIIGIIDGSGDTVGTPTIGTATAGNTRATITFTPPTATGKGSISYTATSSPGGFTGTAAGSPIEVTGLTNGTSYTFTIYALTDYGIQSASSAASNAVTPFAPPVYPPYGTLIAANQCSGFTLYNLRADGSGGTYQEILEYNSVNCGYTPPPPSCPGAGQWTGNEFCSGFDLVRSYTDGSCGTYDQVYIANYTGCGYVPPPPCTYCNGVAVSDSQCCPPNRLYQRSGTSYDGSCGPPGCSGCSCPTAIAWGGWQFVQSGYCNPGGCTYAPCLC